MKLNEIYFKNKSLHVKKANKTKCIHVKKAKKNGNL